MPARDTYHNAVRQALINDGWTVTHDPLTLQIGKKDLYVDLGAQKLLAAEKHDCKIAVEVKSFLGKSEVADLEQALGQFTLYRNIMEAGGSDRELYLAVREAIFTDLFKEPIGEVLLDRGLVRLLVFSAETEEILKWLPPIDSTS